MNTALAGGCLCGGTRYVLEGAWEEIGDCHCADCRRASGAPFVTWGTVKREGMKLVCGAVRDVPHAKRLRSFAACCGTPLFFAEAADTPTIDVTIASLDDPAPWAPQLAIWLEDRLPWVVLNENLPAHRRGRDDA